HAVHGVHDALVVGQRFAHAHEHDVAYALVRVLLAAQAALGDDAVGLDDLVQDLRGGHVAGQARLSGGAERAVHAAAALRGDAQGDAVRVAHQYGLDQRAVEQAPQELDGPAV